MAHLVHESGGILVRVALPESSATPHNQVLEMLAAGGIAIQPGARYIALPDEHPAALADVDRLIVDWDAGAVSVGPEIERPPVVPQSVTKRQLYRGLMQVQWLGTTQPQIDAAVSAMVDSMPEPPREIARSDFFTSRDYLRNNALLVAALSSPPLSKTTAEIDEFFILCGSFPAEG